MICNIAGLPVEVQKKSIKNMHLTVLPPDGRVRVSAPRYMPNAAIEMFVVSKLGWIREQQQKIAARPETRTTGYNEGDTLYVWGKPYTLRLETGGRNSLIIEEDGTAVLTMRVETTPERREAFVKEWYRNELKDAVAVYLPKWERISGLYPSEWQSKDMSTRWGTCNTRTKKIWLNVRLAQHPPVCLEYVILHELAHLRVANHGAEFKAILDKYMPNWREIRKILNN